jgi:glycosyltransferase involved in cell wall biosynthesis
MSNLEKHVYNYNTGTIKYSVVMPVYNQENIILRNLKGIIANTVDNYEIILILDYCYDSTQEKLFRFLDNTQFTNKNLIQITVIINSEIPLFETKCDNIGFKCSMGEYCLEIQSDMQMTQYGYNAELVKPFLKCDNVIGVSGRCAHTMFQSYKGIGKLDIERSVDELGIPRNKFYVLETCNRGPLLLHKKRLEEMNYLDETEYFMDDSDHDLFLRAYLEKGYICGYVPIDFNAPLSDSSNRNKNTYNECEQYIINKTERSRLEKWFESKPGVKKYKERLIPRDLVIYDL